MISSDHASAMIPSRNPHIGRRSAKPQMNLLSNGVTKSHASTQWRVVMFEFADVFAYDLTSTVFVAGSFAALMVLAAAAIWMNRKPAMVTRFSPSYGM
jgi:uncharacterized protein YhhL (DUF1145 family)